jgi:hypothetical protein
MKLLVKSRFTEEDFAVGSVIKMGNHIGNNFQLYWPHPFSPISLLEAYQRNDRNSMAVNRGMLEVGLVY